MNARSSIPLALPALALAVAVAGCASTGAHPSGANAVTVKPGDTGNCATSPCQITLVMPPGDGDYDVLGNEVLIGRFPAGKPAMIGNYFDSQALTVKGADVPKAYVYIPRDL